MSLFGSSGFNLVSAFTDDGSKLTRAQKIHRENERANLLSITRLVLRSFLEQSMRAGHRLIEAETQTLADLLMMLEKVLWHGLKTSGQRSLLSMRTPDMDLWLGVVRVGRGEEAMRETVQCVEQLHHLTTPIARIRAFLRIACMQKKLADFYTVICESPVLTELYEPWALMRQEDVVQLTGALLGMSVVDCNLNVDQDHLQDQPLSVDLSLYIRIPTVGPDGEEDGVQHGLGEEEWQKERTMLLDQNNYLEERNRQLQANNDNLKRAAEDKKKTLDMENEMVSLRSLESAGSVEEPALDRETLWDEERQRLLGQIVEREDTIRTVQLQLHDTKKVNTDLYEKLRAAEEGMRRLEKDAVRRGEVHASEKETLNRSIASLEAWRAAKEAETATALKDDESVRVRLTQSSEQYAKVLSDLESKQGELKAALSELDAFQRRAKTAEKKLEQLAFVEQELCEWRARCELAERRADDGEQALEELGGHLSQQKQAVVELREELMCEAEWMEDGAATECGACHAAFTVARRKHHCRMCGCIFCAQCSVGRVRVVSNPRPVRVCDACGQRASSKAAGGQ